MRRIVLPAIALSAALMIAPSAQACRAIKTPDQRIGEAYAREAELRVALVTITEARHLENAVVRELQRLHSNYEAPWRATASVSEVIVGTDSPALVVFDRNWGPGSCDDGTTMPQPGDRWVVYHVSDHSISAAKVLESYPAAVAVLADPRLDLDGP